MNPEDRIKKLVFNYLDTLFENLFIDRNRLGYWGKLNDIIVFSHFYYMNPHKVFFNKQIARTIMLMFDIDEYDLIKILEDYLANKVKELPETFKLIFTL
jgi:hypothetical protein